MFRKKGNINKQKKKDQPILTSSPNLNIKLDELTATISSVEEKSKLEEPIMPFLESSMDQEIANSEDSTKLTTNNVQTSNSEITSHNNIKNNITAEGSINDSILSSQNGDSNLNTELVPSSKTEFIEKVTQRVHSANDLSLRIVAERYSIMFLDNLVEGDKLNKHILEYLQETHPAHPESILTSIALPNINSSTDLNICVNAILVGSVLIHIDGYSQVILANIAARESRSLSAPENESQVIGAQVGFNESLSTNISLVRRYIINPNLCNEQFQVGKNTNTSVALLYLDGTVPKEFVNTVRQRITELDIDDLIDSAALAELIDDSSTSIFPQMLLTERPDRFCHGILRGKVGIIVDGSSMGIISPYSFIEFFQSSEDKNLRWQISSFVRLLRFLAIFLSIYFSPIYVASLTFHYEVIPQPLLVPLSESRAVVPFPPVLEALFLELVIELLREAGARLPTKVGQTIGIVGGIVIGTAAVQAGITSNILIIIIALGALSSFTTPNYMMGNVIRILRFPIIILAGFWGYYGIMLAFCFLLIHLIRQSSLGAPYLAPFYPPRFKFWPDSIIRMPIPFLSQKSINSRKEATKMEIKPVNPEK